MAQQLLRARAPRHALLHRRRARRATGCAARLEGIDIVVHAAALKQVPAAEYNPFECIKTNVLGAQNLIEACLDSGVQRVVALSTDKAAARSTSTAPPSSARTSCSSPPTTSSAARDLRFSVVRYGNVMGSRGSVIPFFLEQRDSGVLPITDPRMTRFNISLQEGVDMVLWAIEHAWGGEIFVPKIPSLSHHRRGHGRRPDVRAGDRRHPPGREDPRGDDHCERQLQHGGPGAATSRSCRPARAVHDGEYCRHRRAGAVAPGFATTAATTRLPDRRAAAQLIAATFPAARTRAA